MFHNFGKFSLEVFKVVNIHIGLIGMRTDKCKTGDILGVTTTKKTDDLG